MGRLIDADEFENRMYNEAFGKDSDMQKWDSGCWIRYRLFEKVLREQPIVIAEPKKGKWIPTIETRSGQIGWIVYKCSNCSHYRRKPMNYCEVCGAKMER